MTEKKQSCGKTICETTGSCIFGAIWTILACPFNSCYSACHWCCCSDPKE